MRGFFQIFPPSAVSNRRAVCLSGRIPKRLARPLAGSEPGPSRSRPSLQTTTQEAPAGTNRRRSGERPGPAAGSSGPAAGSCGPALLRGCGGRCNQPAAGGAEAFGADGRLRLIAFSAEDTGSLVKWILEQGWGVFQMISEEEKTKAKL